MAVRLLRKFGLKSYYFMWEKVTIYEMENWRCADGACVLSGNRAAAGQRCGRMGRNRRFIPRFRA